MIINYLYFAGFSRSPDKADPPLVIDANAVLAGTVAGELFQAIPRRRDQVSQIICIVEIEQLPPSRPLDGGRQLARHLAIKDFGCLFIRK
jgi:hypothetical protein